MTESDQQAGGDREEVDQLRAELARLRGELAARPAPTPAPATEERDRSGWWRTALVTVLLVLVGLLAPLSVVAIWAHDQIGNTDRYVQTVAPLASDPAVQNAIADRVTKEIFDRLDVKGLTQDAVAALQSRGLPPTASAGLSALATPLANGVESYVHEQVLKLVKTSEFQQAWEAANRSAHGQMVAVLTGKTSGAVSVKGNAVSVNLATIINSVKDKLSAQGFALADKIPTVNAEFTIFESADITRAQNGFRLLGALARGLPIVTLILFGLAIAVARSRRRAVVAGALVVAGSMLLLGVTLNGFRAVYLNAVPPDVLPSDAAGSVYDQLAYFIRLNLRALLVLFLAIALIAWVIGPGTGPDRRTTRGEPGARLRAQPLRPRRSPYRWLRRDPVAVPHPDPRRRARARAARLHHGGAPDRRLHHRRAHGCRAHPAHRRADRPAASERRRRGRRRRHRRHPAPQPLSGAA